MFINPTIAIKNGWITFPDWMQEEQKQKCIQPNAIDFTLDRVFVGEQNTSFVISEKEKIMKKFIEVHPTDKYFTILPHTFYDCMSEFFVKIPENCAGTLIIRSSLNRNGLFLTAGLYDSGFENNIGFVIHNNSSTPAYIAKHTRVGQIIFVDSKSAHTYTGTYNQQKGQHWSSINQ